MNARRTTMAMTMVAGVLLTGLVAQAVSAPGGPTTSKAARIKRGEYLVQVMSCNDCHTPAGPVAKYVVKALNGYHHSMAFTFGGYPENIRARPESRAVVEANCRRCHAELTSEISAHGTLGVSTDPERKADLYGCVRCHQGVGHGPAR